MKIERFYLIIIIVGLFFVRQNFADAKKSSGRLVLENADSGYGEVRDGQRVSILSQNVRLRQDSVIMLCDSAVRYMDDERTMLIGHVHIFDSTKSLFGDKVDYMESQKLVIARDNVRFVDTSKTFVADFLKYFQDSEILMADSNVSIIDINESSTLTGAHLEYHRETGYGKVTGNPVFSQEDSTENLVLTISGDFMEMFNDGDSLRVKDNVEITRGNIVAHGDSLKFFKPRDLIVLESSPTAFEDQDYLTGDAIQLHLKENKVDQIFVLGHAIVTTKVDSPITPHIPYNLLTGDRIWVKLKDQKIDSVRIQGKATSYYHVIEEDEEKGINKVLCDELLILFTDGVVKKVYGSSRPGLSNGQFSPPGKQKQLETELAELLQKLGLAY